MHNPDGRTYAVVRVVGGDVEEIKLRTTLRHANAEVLSMILDTHPELFIMPAPGSCEKVVNAASGIQFLLNPAVSPML